MKNITFINAGAGSGKTYRLTNDLARKLTQEGLDPSQVILTTYTELAAAEFREKARQEILNAKDEKKNAVETSIRIKSATQLDNAFIGTVHAISFRFIRKYWYLLEYGADLQPMSDQNQDFYMSQSISDIVTDKDREVFRNFREAFDIQDKGKPYHLFWLPELKNIVDKMEYYDIESVEESITKSMEVAKEVFWGMPISEAMEAINAYLPLLKERCEGLLTGSSADKAKRMSDAINKAYEVKIISDIRTKGMKECLEGTVGRTNDGFYESKEYQNAMNAYQQTFISKDFFSIIEEYISTIFHLAMRWRESLANYKKEYHVISFDDMEKIFLSMLTEEKYKEVQDDIASNFRLLMVDEFQDSNPIQLKIFNRISELIATNGGHSVWVGDPKQAIYSFRGSDSRFISEILGKFEFSDDGTSIPEQREDMLGTDQLLQSWRSRPALVKFANKIFLEPFKKSGLNGLKEKQITLEPHHTDKTDSMGKTQALYIWCTEACRNKEAQARLLAKQIKALLNSKAKVHHNACNEETSPITYHDIAVLCATNNNCNIVASELRKLGLPASCEETNLIQCLEVYLLKTLLLFMQDPSDKMLRAELAMMLADKTTEEILKDRINYVQEYKKSDEKQWEDHWMDEDSGHEFAEKIKNLKVFTQRYENLSIYDAVVAIHEELDLNNIVEKWGDTTQRKHNLATVANMAKAYDDMCQQMGIGSSIQGFINYLTITKPENKTDNSADTIKVITYHKSKGLEWPVVILYDLTKDFTDKKDLAEKKFRGVNVCEEEGQETDIFNRKHYINLFPSNIGGNGNIPELMMEKIIELPLFKAIEEQSKEEALRLLYVGVTRAKDMLISVTSKNTNESVKWPQSLGIGSGDAKHPFGENHGETLIELEGLLDNNEETKKYRQATNTPAINNAPKLMLSPSTIDTFDDAFTQNEMVAESEVRVIDMSMFNGGQSDTVKGSCIHNIFAIYDPNDAEGNMERVTRTLANYGFSSARRDQKEEVIKSIKWLYDYLTETYGPATRIERECPLFYPLPTGQILRGEIDLQWYFKTSDGSEKCVLIDYKTFPGKRSELEKHTEKYYAQLSAYESALKGAGVDVVDTLIYYPVQAHVRRLIK